MPVKMRKEKEISVISFFFKLLYRTEKKVQLRLAVDRCVERNSYNIFVCRNEGHRCCTAIELLNEQASIIYTFKKRSISSLYI